MGKTVGQAFAAFLADLVPTKAQRDAAARHRASVKSALEKALQVLNFFETGSFSNGTGIRGYSDVDVLVSIGGGRPGSSDTALDWIKRALTARFPMTPIRVDRPAVVVEFGAKTEAWEVIPGFYTGRGGSNKFVYDIPGPAGGWIDTAPKEHLAYVNECNENPAGGAKSLARLAKAWKYYCDVPISSFYLEMRAAQYMKGQASFLPISDLCYFLADLQDHQLAAMNDPKGASGRFFACSSESKHILALSKLSTAASRARKALDAHLAGKPAEAFYYLNLLFNGHFPSR